MFQRVASPIASSAHLTVLNQLDILVGMDFDSVNAFFTRKASFRRETLCQNLMLRMIAKRAMGIIPNSPKTAREEEFQAQDLRTEFQLWPINW